jgi:type IV secretory pathway VirB6-like protein
MTARTEKPQSTRSEPPSFESFPRAWCGLVPESFVQMTAQITAKTIATAALLAAAAVLLSGCLVVGAAGAVGGAAVAVTGTAIGVAGKVVGATARGAGHVVGAVIPDGKKDDKGGS